MEGELNSAFEAAAVLAREAERAARADIAQIPRAQIARAQVGAVFIERCDNQLDRRGESTGELGEFPLEMPPPIVVKIVNVAGGGHRPRQP